MVQGKVERLGRAIVTGTAALAFSLPALAAPVDQNGDDRGSSPGRKPRRC
jgi:hypothetical protein